MDYTKVLKKINTYYLFLKKNNKISLILKNSNKKEIFIDFKNKYLDKVKKEDYNIVNLILLKIKQVPYNPQQPIKMIFGPIKVEITFFELSKRGAIKVNQFETRNNHLCERNFKGHGIFNPIDIDKRIKIESAFKCNK